MHLVRTVLSLVALLAGVIQSSGQDASGPKVPTPSPQDLQTPIKALNDQRAQLQTDAREAFDREAARNKAGDCHDANNTKEILDCLSKESETTGENYRAFVKAIRGLLALTYPEIDDANFHALPQDSPMKPLSSEERVKSLDDVQTTWEQYRKTVTTASYNQYKGGTLAPVFQSEMDQELVRSHMRELNDIFGGILRN